MKHLIVILLAALLLGCTAQGRIQTDRPAAAEQTAQTVYGTQTAQPTSDPKAPPMLFARSDGELTSLLRGSYSWTYPNPDGTTAGVDACGMHPLEAAAYMDTLALHGRTLLLGFAVGGAEPDTLQVRVWDAQYAGDADSYEQNFTWLPTEPIGNETRVTLPRSMDGILEVRARWEGRGDCSYCLMLAADPDAEPPDSVPFTCEAERTYAGAETDGKPTVRVLHAPEPGCGHGAAFFAEQELLEVSFLAPSGSFSYDVKEILMDGNETGVVVNCRIPEVGTSDVCYWTMQIALPTGTVQGDPLLYWNILPISEICN